MSDLLERTKLDEYAEIRAVMTPEERAELDMLLAWEPPQSEVWKQTYAQDPVGFACHVLGYTLSPDLERILESVRDYRITVVRSANSVGKTTTLALIAVWFYLCHPEAKVHTLAAPPLSNLETKLWGEINKISLKKPELFRGFNRGKMWISRQKDRRDATDFIEGIAVPQDADPYQQMASVAGSHAPHQLYEVDEGDGVGDPVYNGIETCMTGEHERLIICYNPRVELGRPWQLEIEERANVIELSALKHPHVVENRVIWTGAVTREITVKRIQEQTRQLEASEAPDAECFEIPTYLHGATAVSDSGRAYAPLRPGYRKVLESDFWHMVLGRFSPKGSDTHYFDRLWLLGRLEYWMTRGENGELLYPPVEVIRAHEGQLMTTWEVYEPPQEGHEYVIGGDAAGGQKILTNKSVDSDFHEAAVYDRCTLRQVAAGWGREGCDPDDFGDDLVGVANHYNEALVIIETNEHGRTTFARMKERHHYPNMYYRKSMVTNRMGKPVEKQDLGFHTDGPSKIVRDDALRTCINEAKRGFSSFDVRSPRQIKQLLNYGKLPGLTAGAFVGHDDGETAISLCALVLVEDPWVDTSGIRRRDHTEDSTYRPQWGVRTG